MPLLLRALCLAFAALLVLHASLAPFVEEGWDFVFPIAIDAGLLWLLWAFWQRKPFAISLLSIYCVVGIIMSLVFGLFADVYGKWAGIMRAQITAEILILFALFIALRLQSTKVWFHAQPET